MKIVSLVEGNTYLKASIPNIFEIKSENTVINSVSISKVTASSNAVIGNSSTIEISNEPVLKAPVYSI